VSDYAAQTSASACPWHLLVSVALYQWPSGVTHSAVIGLDCAHLKCAPAGSTFKAWLVLGVLLDCQISWE
jgi:hypothetical protein